MTDLSRFFDTYATQTRLVPAVFCVLPLIVSLAAWFPDSYELATGLIGSMGILAAALFLAHFSRHRGREVERLLFAEWRGAPASLWLRRTDTNLDKKTKQRYHAFLERQIPGWKAPTPTEEEEEDAVDSIQSYDAAIRWLREHTRDTKRFPLVMKENGSYGFRRNSLGLRWHGQIIAALCLLANSIAVFVYWMNTGELIRSGLVAGTISAMALTIWILVVTNDWVRYAADGYARALLAACEQANTP